MCVNGQAHYWKLDYNNFGVCLKCGETKDFKPLLMKAGFSPYLTDRQALIFSEKLNTMRTFRYTPSRYKFHQSYFDTNVWDNVVKINEMKR